MLICDIVGTERPGRGKTSSSGRTPRVGGWMPLTAHPQFPKGEQVKLGHRRCSAFHDAVIGRWTVRM
jgi:hypothetical protein